MKRTVADFQTHRLHGIASWRRAGHEAGAIDATLYSRNTASATEILAIRGRLPSASAGVAELARRAIDVSALQSAENRAWQVRVFFVAHEGEIVFPLQESQDTARR